MSAPAALSGGFAFGRLRLAASAVLLADLALSLVGWAVILGLGWALVRAVAWAVARAFG